MLVFSMLVMHFLLLYIHAFILLTGETDCNIQQEKLFAFLEFEVTKFRGQKKRSLHTSLFKVSLPPVTFISQNPDREMGKPAAKVTRLTLSKAQFNVNVSLCTSIKVKFTQINLFPDKLGK